MNLEYLRGIYSNIEHITIIKYNIRPIFTCMIFCKY